MLKTRTFAVFTAAAVGAVSAAGGGAPFGCAGVRAAAPPSAVGVGVGTAEGTGIGTAAGTGATVAAGVTAAAAGGVGGFSRVAAAGAPAFLLSVTPSATWTVVTNWAALPALTCSVSSLQVQMRL
jgi:hypothetical protein